MELIAHRVNTLEELRKLDSQYGVELDLRDELNGKIYISHNPFEPGGDFEAYLREYHHGAMVLNIKSERIEHKVLELLQEYGVKKYFFLDSSFPMIKLLSDLGERRIALRFSEFEGMDTLTLMQGRVDWVWVDCFTRFPLDKNRFCRIKELGYRVCLVSPELQGQPEKIKEYASFLTDAGICPDAICTKPYNLKIWKKLSSFVPR